MTALVGIPMAACHPCGPQLSPRKGTNAMNEKQQPEKDMKCKTISSKVDNVLIYLGIAWCGIALEGLITQVGESNALHKPNPL